MKQLTNLSIILFLSGIVACTTNKSSKKEIDKVDWLVGHWNRVNVKDERSAHERWEKFSDSELSGWGVSFNAGDTSFVEKSSIIIQDGILYYVADVPENPAPVFFKFTSISENGFVCENPEHDFPKKIQYEFKNDTLMATTSGDGKELQFKFVKTNN